MPFGATLTEHAGDLMITTPGAEVSDLLVTGAVVVAAPDVTLRRVHVLGTDGDTVRQTKTAPRLTIEDCDLATRAAETAGVVQEAPGLTVRRCRVDGPGNGIVVRSDNATVTENFFTERGVLIESNVSTGVTVEDNVRYRVDAPAWSGSHHLRVPHNRFLGFAPVIGWPDGRPGNEWRGNVGDNGEPVAP